MDGTERVKGGEQGDCGVGEKSMTGDDVGMRLGVVLGGRGGVYGASFVGNGGCIWEEVM